MRDIRITRKCKICGDIMFWKDECFHCRHCKISTDFKTGRLVEFIIQGYIGTPDEVNV
jgi:hypothetical protein